MLHVIFFVDFYMLINHLLKKNMTIWDIANLLVTIITKKIKCYIIAKVWERMTSFLQFNYY